MADVADPKTEQGIGVWCFDESEWVAAASEEEAVQWYEEATGLKVGIENPDDAYIEVTQVSDLDKHSFYDVDDEGDITEDTPRITYREGIKKAIADGVPFPFILCGWER